MTYSGKCYECGFEEVFGEEVWKLKYDTGHRLLKETLKYNEVRREHITNYFQLINPDSPHIKYLLTVEVIEV